MSVATNEKRRREKRGEERRDTSSSSHFRSIMIRVLLCLFVFVRWAEGKTIVHDFLAPDRSPSVAGCPRAAFEFFNGTVRAAYNFVESPMGNIGSSETCPCESDSVSVAFGKSVGLDTGRPYLYLPCYPNSTWGHHEPYFGTCSKPDQSLKIFTSTYKPNPYVNLDIDEVAKVKNVG